jgi:nicotinamide-nucleotide amidase
VIDESLAALLKGSDKTIAFAESCTGGLIAARITEVPGSSAWFGMGVVTYSNEAKMKLLDVPAPMLAMYGAVSDEVARAMAEGMLCLSGADIALSVTGIAGPDGGTAEKPVGTVFIGLAEQKFCRVEKFSFAGNRVAVRAATVESALKCLEQYLLSA